MARIQHRAEEGSLTRARAARHPGGQAGVLSNGLYHVYLGNYQEALACRQKALTGFSEFGNRHGAAHVLDSLGHVCHFLGQDTQALTFCQQSLNASRGYGVHYSQAGTLIHLGETRHVTGNRKAPTAAWQAPLSILIELHQGAGGQPSTATAGSEFGRR